MYLGFDTSNYTTSIAIYDNGQIVQSKKLLTVKPGERGLRQSDAVFQHVCNIPQLINEFEFDNIDCIAVSSRPRNIDGSYMPCFLVGETVAQSIAKTHNVQLHKTSHQIGHILASLYSVNRLDLINERFIAFHLSGGTTEALLVTPSENDIISAEVVSSSTDLKAGQAIDRTGVMLGMSFPCGKELDALSKKSVKDYRVKPTMLGINPSISGVENKAKNMIANGEKDEDIAKFVLTYISETVSSMLNAVLEKYGDMPVVFSGGVSSNSLLREIINSRFNAYFADAEFSLDNAAGIAIYAYLKTK